MDEDRQLYAEYHADHGSMVEMETGSIESQYGGRFSPELK